MATIENSPYIIFLGDPSLNKFKGNITKQENKNLKIISKTNFETSKDLVEKFNWLHDVGVLRGYDAAIYRIFTVYFYLYMVNPFVSNIKQTHNTKID